MHTTFAVTKSRVEQTRFNNIRGRRAIGCDKRRQEAEGEGKRAKPRSFLLRKLSTAVCKSVKLISISETTVYQPTTPLSAR